MGTAATDLVLTAPAWRRWLLLIAMFALGAAYIAVYALFVARSRNFIDVQRNERAETFAQAHAVAVPSHLAFGEGQSGAGMLGGGWYNPEAGGAWSVSADAWIHLVLTAPDSDFELQLNAMAFVVERHARIRIGIDVNDTPLGAWERHPANAGEPMRVHVPETVAKAGKLIVHLHIDKPAAPKQLGPSDDFRQLGVFLTSLDLLGSPSAEPASSSR